MSAEFKLIDRDYLLDLAVSLLEGLEDGLGSSNISKAQTDPGYLLARASKMDHYNLGAMAGLANAIGIPSIELTDLARAHRESKRRKEQQQ